MNNVVRNTDECFEINKIDIDKIRVSKKYPYGKMVNIEILYVMTLKIIIFG